MSVRAARVEPLEPQRRSVRRLKLKPSSVLIALFLFVLSMYFLAPLYWLIVSSTKTLEDLFGTPGLWVGKTLNFGQNLERLFTYNGGIYLRWLGNTFLYAGVSAVVATGVATLGGYALAKFRFRGRNLAFSLILGSILVPNTALGLPLYLLMSRLGLTDTAWAVLLPSFVSPFGVYLARVYSAASVPDELLDAARVDGSSELRTFLTVVLPVLAPALVTIFMFQFVAVWNNFFLPLVMLSSETNFPVTVGLQTWNVGIPSGAQPVLINLIVTGSFVAVVPLLVGFLLLQRYWAGGLTLGSVKG